MEESLHDIEIRARLETHEKVCAERYGNIWDALKDIKSSMQADRIAHATSDAATHTRFNTISNRMWAAVFSVCAGAIMAMMAMAFHLITRAH